MGKRHHYVVCVTLFASNLLGAGTLTAAEAPASSSGDQTAILATAIAEKLDGTEHWAMASGFPRNYTIAEIAKAVLVTVDAAKVPGRIEAAALDRVLAGNVSTQARAALEIVRRECADD